MRIFDELTYAQKLLKSGFSKFMSMPDLIIVAKYFKYIGKSTHEIEEEVYNFCKKHGSEFCEIIYSEKIDLAIKKASKQSLRIPVDVPITCRELETIRSLKNYRYEKILFTMLVLGKYYKLTNVAMKQDGGKGGSKNSKSKYSQNKKPYTPHKEYYINNTPNTIHRLAHTSKKKGENIFHYLYINGFINNVIKTDSYVLTFTTTDDDSATEILVTDINDIIRFYPPYCEQCGKELIKKSNSHKMCLECQDILRKEKKNNWRKNYYKNTKL